MSAIIADLLLGCLLVFQIPWYYPIRLYSNTALWFRIVSALWVPCILEFANWPLIISLLNSLFLFFFPSLLTFLFYILFFLGSLLIVNLIDDLAFHTFKLSLHHLLQPDRTPLYYLRCLLHQFYCRIMIPIYSVTIPAQRNPDLIYVPYSITVLATVFASSYNYRNRRADLSLFVGVTVPEFRGAHHGPYIGTARVRSMRKNKISQGNGIIDRLILPMVQSSETDISTGWGSGERVHVSPTGFHMTTWTLINLPAFHF